MGCRTSKSDIHILSPSRSDAHRGMGEPADPTPTNQRHRDAQLASMSNVASVFDDDDAGSSSAGSGGGGGGVGGGGSGQNGLPTRSPFVRRVLNIQAVRRGVRRASIGVNDTSEELLRRLQANQAPTMKDIHDVFRAAMAQERSLEFYTLVVELFIQKGEPLLACDVLRRAGEVLGTPPQKLTQLRALALAQSGSTQRAMKELEALRAAGDTSAETGGVLARCYKDLAARERNPMVRHDLYQKAFDIYYSSFEGGDRTSYYTGINAATMALILGRTADAQSLAATVVDLCTRELDSSSDTDTNAYWVLATLGEAAVICGNSADAISFYKRAVASAPKSYGRYASSLRQLSLLLSHLSVLPQLTGTEGADSLCGSFMAAVRAELGSAGLGPPTPTQPGASARDPELLRESKIQTACDRVRRADTREEVVVLTRCCPVDQVLEALQQQKPLDDQLRRIITFELQTLDGSSTMRPVDQIITAAVFVVATRLFSHSPTRGAGQPSISLALFQHIFGMPTVVVSISAISHRDVVPDLDNLQSMHDKYAAMLAKISAGFVFGCPGSIGDIVFLEAARERGCELWLVLPVPERYFQDYVNQVLQRAITTSLANLPSANDPRAGTPARSAQAWLARYKALLRHAVKVDISNDMSREVSAANQHYSSQILTGLALMKARKLDCVLERVLLKPIPIGQARPSFNGQQSPSSHMTKSLDRSIGSGSHHSMNGSGTAGQGSVSDLSETHSRGNYRLAPVDVSVFGTPRKAASRFWTEQDCASAASADDAGAASVMATADADAETKRRESSEEEGETWMSVPEAVEHWDAQGLSYRILFVPSVRAVDTVASDPATPTNTTVVPSFRGLTLARPKTTQIIKAILFADIVGYSKLQEHEVLSFIENFMGLVSRLLDEMPHDAQPQVRNTWGDAFYFVFDHVRDAGEFALKFVRLVVDTKWREYGLPENLNIRISLHAAPVFAVIDPVTKLVNFTGVHTSRAARIEPITPPGCVYCSLAFAAMSQTLAIDSFDCTYVGNVPLAKDYGMQQVYHVSPSQLLLASIFST